MPSLGNLYVTLGAKADGLDTAVSKAKKNLGSLSDVARSTARTVSLVGAAAVGAGAGIVIGLVNSGRQAIDVQAKLAQALDGTIGGLRAAEMALGDAGVSSDEFATAAARMNQALGNAYDAASPAAKALDSLGLSAENLLKLDIDQRFAAIADAMAEHNLNGAQAQSIMRDMGVRSENLANAMRHGGEAFREQAREVDRLGLRLSMVDAAQVELANDSIGVFGDVLQGVQDKLTVTAAPYITVLAEKFREAAVESEGFRDITKSAIDGTIKGFGFAADAVHGFGIVLKGVQLIGYGFGAAIVSSLQIAIEGFAKLDEGVTFIANKIIADLNWMGANIQQIDPFTNSPMMQGIREFGDVTRDQVGIVRAEMAEMAMQPLPSEGIKKFMEEVEVASKKAAETVVASRKTMGLGGTGDDPKAAAEAEKAAADLAKRNAMELEGIKNRYITEEQLNVEHRERMAIIGEEYDAAKFETENQWRSIREQAEAEHLDRMTDLNRSAYEGIANIIETRWGGAAASTAGAFKSILGTMATGSRKAFEISKGWATADALISTFQGIAKGVSKGFAGIPEIAWATATGFAQVSAIKNQSFGGAGGAAAAGAGTPATAGNPVGVGGSAEQQSGGTYRFEGLSAGSFVSSDMVVEMLKQAQKDGALRGQIMFA